MNGKKITAASVSRKLATAFQRENYFAPGHISGWGTLSAGFKVSKKDETVTVEWIAYSTADEIIAAKVDEMAAFLIQNDYLIEEAKTWRGPFIIVKASN